MSDRILVPARRMRQFALASRAMADDVRPRAGSVDAALDRVATTTDPGFRPPVFGDGHDVRRWCDAVLELDTWVDRVARLFEGIDDPTHLYEALLLGLAGSPDLPPVGGSCGTSGLAALLELAGLDRLPADQTIEEFDHVRDALAARPDLLGPWLDALTDEQRDRLVTERWGALIGMDGLTLEQRGAVEAAARADLPRWREWETVAQEYGWGFASIGTRLHVERLVEYDGDVFLTIAITDSVAGKLDESVTGSLLEVSYGGTTSYRLVMSFDSMDELEATLDDIDDALLPGNPDVPWWAAGMGPRQTIEFSNQTELELAGRLEKHRDHVVGQTRAYGLTQDLEVLDGLFTADGAQEVGVNRNTGNTVVSTEIRAGLSAAGMLPDSVLVHAGRVEAATQSSVELAPDGEVVARTTTTTFSGAAGTVEVDTPRGGVTFGTDRGTEVVHTVTTDADGRTTESVVLADTEVERFGFSLAPDPRYPRASLSYEAGEATTTRVYVRGDDGTWQEIV